MNIEEAFLVSTKLMLQKLEELNELSASVFLLLQQKGVFTAKDFQEMLAKVQQGPQATAARKMIESIGEMTPEQALEILKGFQGPLQ